ncbi:hypothetical protein JMN32_15095 [Fulvivirga sp. 29W222]|uniref:Uncharacterized protein n=1 Tax=Fulvivirga marina TaxID=2494733 RepID=A0A937FZ41_9BACT|nr:hypothetical protein [Fulvivirga marina]MBL6447643.1 hypothetical protein [Fulvivirga marina]
MKTKNYKRRGLLIFLLLLFSSNLFSQDYQKSLIDVNDIVKGISDFDYFKAILLEKGFKYKESNQHSEYWRVPVNYGNEATQNLFSQIAIQLSTWKDANNDPFEKSIYIQIRKDLLPDYSSQFHTIVTTYFSEKRANKLESTIHTVNGTETKEDYELIYYNKDSNITVEYEESDKWVKFMFSLEY